MSLFPIIQPEAATAASPAPVAREIKWDFERNAPVFSGGVPVVVTGAEAVTVWAWKALHVPRRRLEIYTWDYGNEAEALLGQPYTDELKQAEAERYVRECLLVSPYITDVSDVAVSYTDGGLSVSCKINTIYGEVTLSV